MSLTLMYISNDPAVALIAEKNGVDRIWIDLETLGKEERQKGMNTVKSHHSIENVRTISPLLTRAEMLERLGIKWEVKRNNRWEESYEAAKEYERENGNVNVPADYVTKEGFGLGRWINRQRDEYESLTPEKKRKLNEIGITGERESAWDRKFEIVKKYYEEHGDINIPPECVINGVWISRWLSDQVAKFNGKITGRTKKPLTDEQREKLTSIGIAGRTTRTYRRKNLSAAEK